MSGTPLPPPAVSARARASRDLAQNLPSSTHDRLHKEPKLPANPIVAPAAAVAANTRDCDGIIDNGNGREDSAAAWARMVAWVPPRRRERCWRGRWHRSGFWWRNRRRTLSARSGIQPPRLLREVKAGYTEEARKRGLSGSVVLEIVVRKGWRRGRRQDPSGSRCRTGRSRGASRAAVALRSRTRQGAVVDVVVEVAVEFTLR